MLSPSKGLAVFTDGSASYKDRTGGWAWIAIDCFDNEVTDSGAVSDTSIGAMELRACVEALTGLSALCGSSEILVYCDSLYVVLGNREPWRNRRKNRKIWDELDDAIKLHQYVEWNHIPGHGEYDNPADKLAGKARRAAAHSKTVA